MTYTEFFYEEETRVAYESAQHALPGLVHPGDRIIDIGSGTGAWAFIAAELGCTVRAVDRDIPEHLALLPVQNCDLNGGYDCTGWDLAICLEVAEHLNPEAARPLVEGLAHAGRVLFSAATPDQPGVNHVNCQPHDYWHGLFAAHYLYPTHIGETWAEPVADFYCRNTYLYEPAT